MQQSSKHEVNDLTIIDSKNHWLDKAFTGLVWFFAGCTVVLLFWMSWIIFDKAMPAISKYGLGFLWGQEWDVGGASFWRITLYLWNFSK